MPSIFVGNLPYNASETQLEGLFGRYGRVSSVRIMTDSATNRPRGFAFVNMPALEDSEEAIKSLSGSSMQGRRLTVRESENRSGRGNPQAASRHQANSQARTQALELFDALRSGQD